MYRHVLLAYDGSVEGRRALREGALLARACGAKVFLLSVIPSQAGVSMAESVVPGAMAAHYDTYLGIFEEALGRLKAFGFDAAGELASGEAAQEIAACAGKIGADLVVVGHRKQTFLSRWWSGPSSASLVDQVSCSVLVSRNSISDEAFAAALANVDPALSSPAIG